MGYDGIIMCICNYSKSIYSKSVMASRCVPRCSFCKSGDSNLVAGCWLRARLGTTAVLAKEVADKTSGNHMDRSCFHKVNKCQPKIEEF